jgi:hypothetical protein
MAKRVKGYKGAPVLKPETVAPPAKGPNYSGKVKVVGRALIPPLNERGGGNPRGGGNKNPKGFKGGKTVQSPRRRSSR